MIGYYLSSNNETCYNNFSPYFSRTKRGLDKLWGSSARFPYASAIGWQRGHASTHGVLCSNAVLPHHVQEQEAMSTTTPQGTASEMKHEDEDKCCIVWLIPSTERLRGFERDGGEF